MSGRRPPFYLRGGIPKQTNRIIQPRQQQILEQQSPRTSSARTPHRIEIINVPRDDYLKLFTFLREKYGNNIQRRWNSFYDITFAKVAFLKSSEVVVLFLTDATSKRVNLFEMKISDIELAPKIDVSREFYGYLRRHIESCAGAGRTTFRRGNNFYTEEGTLVAELISPEKVRIYTQIRTGLFGKLTTKEVNIADLKPERIHIPRELLFITKKLFGSYRRYDRCVRMESGDHGKASLISSLNLPEVAKAFFGKSTIGLTEDEVKYLITSWAGDIANKRRARTTNNKFSNHPTIAAYITAPPRPVPASPLVETAVITIDGEPLSIGERLEVFHRLGLEEEKPHYLRASRPTNLQTEFSSRNPTPQHPGFKRHELRKPRDLDRALRREEEQYIPLTGV